jgi:hypothetical protein
MTDAEFIKLLFELLRVAVGAEPTAQTSPGPKVMPNHADATATSAGVRFGRSRRRRRHWARRHSLDAARARLKEEAKIQRRRRIAQLHPDKLGRDQTPEERAEYVGLTRKRR